MALASNNPFPSVLVTEQSSAPASPAAGKQRVYVRTSDHHLVRVNSSGTVTDIESGGSAFGTVAVSGQSDVVADVAADTLTLAAGSNITLTTNAGTDTVTIAASGGAGNASANDKLLGSGNSGSGSPYAEITLGTNLSMSGTTLNATGGGSASITAGAFASLPGTSAVGDMYVFTDSVFNYAVCTTTNVWRYFIRGKEGSPIAPVSGWTGTNTGANWTATDSGGGADVVQTSSSLNWRLLRKAVPGGTPYTITMLMVGSMPVANTSTKGLYFYDGTKLMGIEFLTQAAVAALRVEKMNSVTSDNSTSASMGNAYGLPSLDGGVWVRIANNGTNLIFSWSMDGVTFRSLFSEAVGTFITPTHYGFGGVNVSSFDNLMSFQSILIA